MTAFDNIKKIAKKRGMSLQEVSKKAGYSANLIYQYKEKTEPTMETLRNIAKVLGVDVGKLVNDENSITSNTKTADLADDDTIFTFEGKRIPPEDLEYMKRILIGGHKKSKK